MNLLFVNGRAWSSSRNRQIERLDSANHLRQLKRFIDMTYYVNIPDKFKYPTKLAIEQVEIGPLENVDENIFKDAYLLREFDPQTNYTKRIFVMNVQCQHMINPYRWGNFSFHNAKIVNKSKYYSHAHLTALLGRCFAMSVNSSINKRLTCNVKILCDYCSHYEYDNIDMVEASVVVNSPSYRDMETYLTSKLDCKFSLRNVIKKVDIINKTPYIKLNYYVLDNTQQDDEEEINIVDLIKTEMIRLLQEQFTNHSFVNDVFTMNYNE